ncbi:hypothetical protein [Caulobacter sp. DWR2-3-1b2]|uniref:hypothetical protein n=1 Tax=unclassified Caulobacter TaxID=2648921 RepID=UPI003CF1F9DD
MRDAETPAAQVAGPVEVAVAGHHGMYDASGADVVRALRPRAWIVQGWHAAHPSTDALKRMLSQRRAKVFHVAVACISAALRST